MNGVPRSALPPTPGLILDHANHLVIDLEDTPAADLLARLPEVTAWVRSARAGGGQGSAPPRVLIHCAAGVSRSPAVLAAVLMAE